MSEEKKWNDDEILDVGSVDEDDFDPFGDDDFELESQQHEEKKAEEKRQEDKTLEKLQLDKNIKLRYDSGIVIAGNMMKRNGFDQKM